jgi:hypothetical protein
MLRRCGLLLPSGKTLLLTSLSIPKLKTGTGDSTMKSDNVVRAVLLSLLSLSTATPVSENETVDSLTYEYVIVGSGPGGGTLA